MNQTTNPSVLALLRGLAPRRPLSFNEQLHVAELQANHLRRAFDVATAATPDEVITELPRIRVDFEANLPVSGAAHWNGRYWLITLNADDHPARQRFSLMHEFKHIVDHTRRALDTRNNERAERVADYFAACALMPKMLLTRLWCRGVQDVPELASRFRVSPSALRYRLDQLGLRDDDRARCSRRRQLAALTEEVAA